MTATRTPTPSPQRRRPGGRSPSATTTTLVALLTVGVLGGLAVLGVTAQRGLPLTDYYELSAEFRDAANIKAGSDVRSAGRRIGQVTEVSRRDGHAVVLLQLEPAARPFRQGTTARIRLKGLLGGRFVELNAGTAGAALADRATIPLAETSTTVDLPDVFQAFDRGRRAHLGVALRGLGQGFAGRGDEMGEALGGAPSYVRDLTDVARAINHRTGAAERLFPSSASAAEALAPVREPIATGFGPAARALAPFVDRRAAVHATLEQGAPTLEAVRSALERTDPLLRQVRRFAAATRDLTRPAPAALRAAAALLRESDRPLERARPLLSNLGNSLPEVNRLVSGVDPLIQPLRRNLRTLDPALREIKERRCDLLSYVRNWRSMFAFGFESDDPLGPETGWRLQLVSMGTTAGLQLPFASRYAKLRPRCVTPEPLR